MLAVNSESGQRIVWQSRTANTGVAPFKLVVNNDGMLTLTDSGGRVVWKAVPSSRN